MGDLPSNYQMEKALRDSQAVDFEAKKELITSAAMARKELFSALPDEMEDEALSPIEQARNEQDLTLTPNEKTLTEKQLKFAWAMAKVISGREKGSQTSCAIAAGYSEGSAAKEGSKQMKNPRVYQAILDRQSTESRLRGFNKEFVLSETLELYLKAKAAVPVQGKDGNPTGFYAEDTKLQAQLLAKMGQYLGMEKEAVSDGRSDDAPKMDAKEVGTTILGIAALIKGQAKQEAVDEARTVDIGLVSPSGDSK